MYVHENAVSLFAAAHILENILETLTPREGHLHMVWEMNYSLSSSSSSSFPLFFFLPSPLLFSSLPPSSACQGFCLGPESNCQLAWCLTKVEKKAAAMELFSTVITISSYSQFSIHSFYKSLFPHSHIHPYTSLRSHSPIRPFPIPSFSHTVQAQAQDPYVLGHMDTYARLLTNIKKLEKSVAIIVCHEERVCVSQVV